MNISIQATTLLDALSDAALLLHRRTASIHHMNQTCQALLEQFQADSPSQLHVASFFREPCSLQALLNLPPDQAVQTFSSVPMVTGLGHPIYCSIKVVSAQDDLLCCILHPVQPPAPVTDAAVDHSSDPHDFFFQAIQALSSDLLFRFHVPTSTMHYFGRVRQVHGLPERSEHYPHSVFEIGCIHEKDHQALLEFVQNVKNGLEIPSYIRILREDGGYHWYKKDYVIRRDAQGEVIEAVGKVTNIQAEKELESQVNLDMLTGCLMKMSFENLCSHYIETAPDLEHALLMIDLDHFKAVNDNLGHQFGDMVLREVGEKIRTVFRSSDYVGRVGGDEFMVFMKNISDSSILEQKAQEVLSLLDTTYQGSHHSYHISGSIGIARYPKDGEDFKHLYDHADVALYDVKNRGKNSYVMYDDQLSKGTMENTLPFDVAARTLSQYFDAKIVAEVFNLLFESRDLDISMQRVLQIIGTRFATSRAYVFDLDGVTANYYVNTYEWCAEGIQPEQEHLQEVPVELLEPFFRNTNAEGILYCNDLSTLQDQDAREIMEMQGIQSFLHANIGTPGRYTYVIGFDDCHTTRIWSPIEISTLLYISKIIALFLNHSKILQAVTAISEERMSALNSISFSSYIIDMNTHELTFYNDFIKSLIPDLRLGDLCYQAIRGLDCECPDCPLKTMRENQTPNVRSMIYSKKLNRHLLVNASCLNSYDGRASIFVATNDVSDLVDTQKNCQ